EINLLGGHSIYHEAELEAGVVRAISIAPGPHIAVDLTSLCEELRFAAGLEPVTSDALALEALFVVPYKEMAIEGYYLPKNDGLGGETLVPGNHLSREILDEIVGRAGIPTSILDETDVEHEISCKLDEPSWHVRWEDVRPVGGEEPDAVIDRASHRFTAMHQSIIDHSTRISLHAAVNELE
ncbi:MAG: hypothetical protein ACR2P3_07235, partial [Geminicoccaceae bacterium]